MGQRGLSVLDVNGQIAEWIVGIFNEIGDPSPLAAQAEQYDAQAETVRRVHDSLTVRLNNTAWDGAVAEQNRQVWRAQLAAVEDASQMSRRASQTLRRHHDHAKRIGLQIVGVILEIIEVLLIAWAMSAVLGWIVDAVYASRIAILIRQAYALTAQLRALCAATLDAMRSCGAAAARVVGFLEKDVAGFASEFARAYPGYYLGSAAPQLLSGRAVDWKADAWQSAILKGLDFPMNLGWKAFEATTVGKKLVAATKRVTADRPDAAPLAAPTATPRAAHPPTTPSTLTPPSRRTYWDHAPVHRTDQIRTIDGVLRPPAIRSLSYQPELAATNAPPRRTAGNGNSTNDNPPATKRAAADRPDAAPLAAPTAAPRAAHPPTTPSTLTPPSRRTYWDHAPVHRTDQIRTIDGVLRPRAIRSLSYQPELAATNAPPRRPAGNGNSTNDNPPATIPDTVSRTRIPRPGPAGGRWQRPEHSETNQPRSRPLAFVARTTRQALYNGAKDALNNPIKIATLNAITARANGSDITADQYLKDCLLGLLAGPRTAMYHRAPTGQRFAYQTPALRGYKLTLRPAPPQTHAARVWTAEIPMYAGHQAVYYIVKDALESSTNGQPPATQLSAITTDSPTHPEYADEPTGRTARFCQVVAGADPLAGALCRMGLSPGLPNLGS